MTTRADRSTITFLSDYGLEGAFVGMCHGVMARIFPEARIIDVTHGIPRHDIGAGALALRDAIVHLPYGVHLAVVDPEVGKERFAVAIRAADGQCFVGPDTGMHMPALARLGGVAEAVDIGSSSHCLEPTSATFHGRDIFSPVAARLAVGDSLTEVGTPLDPAELVRYELPRAKIDNGTVLASVLTVDRFGNVVLNIGRKELVAAEIRSGATLEIGTDRGEPLACRFVSTFADVAAGEPLLFVDAQHMLSLAVNRGSAANHFGLETSSEVVLRPIST